MCTRYFIWPNLTTSLAMACINAAHHILHIKIFKVYCSQTSFWCYAVVLYALLLLSTIYISCTCLFVKKVDWLPTWSLFWKKIQSNHCLTLLAYLWGKLMEKRKIDEIVITFLVLRPLLLNLFALSYNEFELRETSRCGRTEF